MKKLFIFASLIFLFASCAKQPLTEPQFPHFDGYESVWLPDYLHAGFTPPSPSRLADVQTYTISEYNAATKDAVLSNPDKYIIFISGGEYAQYYIKHIDK
jgi:hypothetical protein